MDNNLDNLLDTYLFETNSLLEQLDELLINAEKNTDFTSDDVNEIFRIMHTIKGSSAMLEFTSLMTIAHHIEDLFFYIRENGISKLDSTHKSELFNLMFKSTDKLREEVQKVENNEPLSTNIDNVIAEINSFLDKSVTKKRKADRKAPPLFRKHLRMLLLKRSQARNCLCPISRRIRECVLCIFSLMRAAAWKISGLSCWSPQ